MNHGNDHVLEKAPEKEFTFSCKHCDSVFIKSRYNLRGVYNVRCPVCQEISEVHKSIWLDSKGYKSLFKLRLNESKIWFRMGAQVASVYSLTTGLMMYFFYWIGHLRPGGAIIDPFWGWAQWGVAQLVSIPITLFVAFHVHDWAKDRYEYKGE